MRGAVRTRLAIARSICTVVPVADSVMVPSGADKKSRTPDPLTRCRVIPGFWISIRLLHWDLVDKRHPVYQRITLPKLYPFEQVGKAG
jgi:hypothetical protein